MLTTHLCFVVIVVMVSGLQVFDQCGDASRCPEGSLCTYRGCDGRLCLCKDGLLPDSNRTTCVQGITLGANCSGSSICRGQPFSQCINNVCQCKDGYKRTVSSTGLGTHCLPVSQGSDGKVEFVDYNETCGVKNRQCSFDLKCLDGTCLCPNETRLATNKELAASPYSYFLCRPKTFKLGIAVNTSSEECQKPDKTSPRTSTLSSTVKSTTPSVTTRTTRLTTAMPTTTLPTTVPTSSTTPSTTTSPTTISLTTPSTTHAATTTTTLKSTVTSRLTSTLPQTTTKTTTEAATSKSTASTTTTALTTKRTTVALTDSPTTTISLTPQTVTSTASPSTTSVSSSSTSKETTTEMINKNTTTISNKPTSSALETTNEMTKKQTFPTSPRKQSTNPPKEISTNMVIEVSSSTVTYTTEASVSIGDSCAGRICPNNSNCEEDSCGERRCRCQLGYATSPDGRSCFKLAALGETCTGPNLCQGQFTECTESGVCECQSEYESSDTGKWCRLKSRWLVSFPLLGESCSSGFFSSCYIDFEQECVNSRCMCQFGGRDVGDDDRYAMYPDLRQCRNSSFEEGEREKSLCKNQSKQSFSTDIYDKAKAKIKRMQVAIIGGSVGFLVLVGIIIGLVVLIRWKRRGRRQVIRDTSSMASSERYSFKIPRPFAHYVGAKEYDAQQIAYPNPTFQNDSVTGVSRPDLLNVTEDSSTLLDTDQS